MAGIEADVLLGIELEIPVTGSIGNKSTPSPTFEE
jgi:hypothetical protein